MSYFNVDTITDGCSLDQQVLNDYIRHCDCKVVPIHGVGDFVCFVPGKVAVEHVGMLNMAPDGAMILVREHYEIDMHVVKNQGVWYIFDVVDRRTIY